MSLNLKKIWKDKTKILEGITNTLFIKEEVEKVALHRQAICQENTCGFYDPQGQSEKAVIKGSPACSICGCNISLLSRSLSSKCSLYEIGKEPLWEEELTKQEEQTLPK